MGNIKIEFKWAILFSVMGLLWMLPEKLSGLHSTYIDYQLYITNLFVIPAVWVIVQVLKGKKRTYYGGEMSYKQGLISGIILSLSIALISPLTQWITSYVITPEYSPNVLKRSVEIGYYKTTAEAQANFNYKNYSIQGVIGTFIMGMVITAIVMIFIRKKKLNTTG